VKPKLLVGVVAGAVAVGAAYFTVRAIMGPIDDAAVRLVPTNAAIYANVFINPSRTQKRELRELLAEFEKAPTAEEAGDLIAKLADRELSELGLDYSDDVEPWLGRQIAFFATVEDFDDPAAAALVATKDAAATRRFLRDIAEHEDAASEARSYKGVDYDYFAAEELASGFVEDFWVVGTEAGFKDVVDSSDGPALADDPGYERATAPLTDDYLALGFFDTRLIVDAVVSSRELGENEAGALKAIPGLGSGVGPGASTIALSREGVVMDTFAPAEGTADSGLFDELPADSWLGLGFADVGRSVSSLLDVAGPPVAEAEARFEAETGFDLRTDLLAWMGDAGVFVKGAGLLGLGGGAIVESTDPQASTDAVERMLEIASHEVDVRPAPPVNETGGFTFTVPETPVTVTVMGIGGDRVAVSVGSATGRDALAPAETLADSEALRDALPALGDGFDPVLFVDFDSVERLTASVMGAESPQYKDDIRPWLEPFDHVVSGSKLDDGGVIARTVIGVK